MRTSASADDIGLLAVAIDAARGLYRVVDAAYEKRAVAATSNLHAAGFDELMPKTFATAALDRLLHNPAFAKQEATPSTSLRPAGKGVTPLN